MITNGMTVTLNYTGKINTGEVFDTTEGRDPYQFIIGVDPLLEGFQEALMGKSIGDKFTVEIPMTKAYGDYKENKKMTVPKDKLSAEVKLDQILVVSSDGHDDFKVIVTEINEENIVVDANHPLAGMDLTFDIEILDAI